jgi:micrococcal nuclease
LAYSSWAVKICWVNLDNAHHQVLSLVEIVTKDIDRYDQTVAVVILPNVMNLNEEIVRAGYAWVYPQYCKDMPMCLGWANLQQEAMEARRGLWMEKEPVPP